MLFFTFNEILNQSRLRENIVIQKSFGIYAFGIIPEKPLEELLKIILKNMFFEFQIQKLQNFKKFFEIINFVFYLETNPNAFSESSQNFQDFKKNSRKKLFEIKSYVDLKKYCLQYVLCAN